MITLRTRSSSTPDDSRPRTHPRFPETKEKVFAESIDRKRVAAIGLAEIWRTVRRISQRTPSRNGIADDFSRSWPAWGSNPETNQGHFSKSFGENGLSRCNQGNPGAPSGHWRVLIEFEDHVPPRFAEPFSRFDLKRLADDRYDQSLQRLRPNAVTIVYPSDTDLIPMAEQENADRPAADPRLKVLKKFRGKFLPKGTLRERHRELMKRWDSGDDHGGVTFEELKSLLDDWRSDQALRRNPKAAQV